MSLSKLAVRLKYCAELVTTPFAVGALCNKKVISNVDVWYGRIYLSRTRTIKARYLHSSCISHAMLYVLLATQVSPAYQPRAQYTSYLT